MWTSPFTTNGLEVLCPSFAGSHPFFVDFMDKFNGSWQPKPRSWTAIPAQQPASIAVVRKRGPSVYEGYENESASALESVFTFTADDHPQRKTWPFFVCTEEKKSTRIENRLETRRSSPICLRSQPTTPRPNEIFFAHPDPT